MPDAIQPIDSRTTRRLAAILTTALAAIALVAVPGCAVAGLVSVMARTWQETSTKVIAPEYEGLSDKSFAVVVDADRGIQGVHPQLVTRLTELISTRLANPDDTNASGFVPARYILEFQLTNPTWTSWTYDKVMEEFGVDRLIVVEVHEFRLNEPGNQYIWDGLAAAHIGVVEAESTFSDDFEFTREVRVAYPDGQGFTRNDLPKANVYGFLERRLVDRLTWLFYEHDEDYHPDY